MNEQVVRTLPLLITLLLFTTLGAAMLHRNTAPPVPSPLTGQTIAPFELPLLTGSGVMNSSTFKGQPVLLNIFASWCESCAAEHDILLTLAKTKKIPLYGIAWKDKPEKTSTWLQQHGTPYQQVANDTDGQITIPLALTGVPETLILDSDSHIIFESKMPITDEIVNTTILPLLDQLNGHAQ